MKATTQETRRRDEIHPPADVSARPDGVHLSMEMPGADSSTVSVTVEDDVLTVSADRKTFGEGYQVVRRETQPGTYRRSFRLSKDLARDGLTADYKLGVLRVFLPMAEQAVPRKIEVRIET